MIFFVRCKKIQGRAYLSLQKIGTSKMLSTKGGRSKKVTYEICMRSCKFLSLSRKHGRSKTLTYEIRMKSGEFSIVVSVIKLVIKEESTFNIKSRRL